MEKINTHIHSTGSDGKLTPKEIIDLAIEKKFDFICFTDHFKRRKIFNEWSKKFFSNEYIDEINRLTEYYKDRIEIGFGAEIDWINDDKTWIKEEILKNDFDYIIGSVHILRTPKGTEFGINFDETLFLQSINEFNGIKNLVTEYYKQIRLLSKSKLFDSVGHFDVIKYFNNDSKYFDEQEKWYQEEVLKTLKDIKKNNLIIEINTSGCNYQCKESFPSFWIIKKAKKLGIPLTIGTDAHSLHQLDFKLSEAIDLAKKAGYKEIVKFKKRKMIKIPI
jgi:histidinol-phosphatase (PHP family)